jgi:ligand-binding SRPBCC domain-containing protein
MIHTFRASTIIPRRVFDVFAFFSTASNLERITPPELRFRIVAPEPIEMGEGTLIHYRLRLYGIPFNWSSLITLWDPPHRFVDEQDKGPYKQWVHTHAFYERGGVTRMIDEVLYRLPLWPMGEVFYPLIHHQLSRIFRFREKAIQAIFKTWDRDSRASGCWHRTTQTGNPKVV